MKFRQFKWMSALMAIIMVATLSLGVYAAQSSSASKDGIVAELSTDKESYTASETVDVQLKIVNQSGKQVQVKSVISGPDGLEISAGKTHSGRVAIIGAGDSIVTHEVAFEIESENSNPGQQVPPPGDGTQSGDPAKNEETKNEVSKNESVETESSKKDSATLVETVSAPKNGRTQSSSSASTGDSAKTGVWLVAGMVALAAVIGLMIWHKKNKNLLSLLLCITLAGSLLIPATPVNAETLADQFQVNHEIQVDGKPVTLSATVYYEFGEAGSAENLIVNDYTNSKWTIEVKTINGDNAVATCTHPENGGSDSENGCVYYDISYAGGNINVFQIKYDLAGTNIIQTGHKYKVGFKAKLVDKDNSEEHKTIKVGTCKLREGGNSADYSNNVSFHIEEGDWKLYEYELVANSNQDEAQLLYQFGGNKTRNVDLYFDEFFLIDMGVDSQNTKNVTIALGEGVSEEDVVFAGNANYGSLEKENTVNFYAASDADSGLVFDSWTDEYGNKVSANSYYEAALKNSAEYVADFGEYEYTAKTLSVPEGEELALTVGEPTIQGNSTSASATVSAPSGWTVEECGVIFYPGYWTENFNIFSENIEIVPANTVTNGSFDATAELSTQYGILAKAYAIAKNEDNKLVIQYSDSAYTANSGAPEKATYKTVTYLEALGLFTQSDNHSYKGHKEFVDMVAATNCDVISFCPSMYKMNCWDSEVDGYWSSYANSTEDTNNEKYKLSWYEECKDYILDSNGDPVKDVIDAVNAINEEENKDIKLFLDYRMNDNHNNDKLDYPTHTPFWRNHEEYWVDSESRAFNYLCTEVQDYYYAILEELFTNYDVDGLTMDLDRYRELFRAEEAERGAEVFTEFVGRVKELVNKISIDEGRDIQLTIRVPETVEKCELLGMDVTEWDSREYVDTLYVGTHYFNTQEADIEGFLEEIENAKVMGIVHYVTAQSSGNASGRRYSTKEVAYATAKSYMDRGADGVFWWNMQYVVGQGDAWKALVKYHEELALATNAEALKAADKNYVLANPDMAVSQGRTQDVKIYINEDTSNYNAALLRVEATSKFDDSTSIKVTFNGTELTETTHNSPELFEPVNNNAAYATANKVKFFTVPLDAFVAGYNQIHTENVSGYEVCGSITGIEIALYKDKIWDTASEVDDGNLLKGGSWIFSKKMDNQNPNGLADVIINAQTDSVYYDITDAGTRPNALEMYYSTIDLEAGTYKLSFNAKLVEKVPTDESKIIRVNHCKLINSKNTQEIFSETATPDIVEGDWTNYQYIFSLKEAKEAIRLLIQMSGDGQEKGLDLHLKDFRLEEYKEPESGAENNPSLLPENMLTLPYTEKQGTEKAGWEHSVKKSGNVLELPKATGEVKENYGYTPSNGCIHYDITDSGKGCPNAFQISYQYLTLTPGTSYKVGFKAELKRKNNSDEVQSLDVTVCRLRPADNIAYSNDLKFKITEGTGGWISYEGVLTLNDQVTTEIAKGKLIYQIGTDDIQNVDLYLDDFYMIPIETETPEPENPGDGSENNPSLSKDNMLTLSYDVKQSQTKDGWEYGVLLNTTNQSVTLPTATVELMTNNGTTPTDGCIHYDITDAGRNCINAFQISYMNLELTPGTSYKVGFKAKLVEKTASDTEQTLTVNVCKLRKFDSNNTEYSDVKKFEIKEGEWTNYETTLTMNADKTTTLTDGKLIYQIGKNGVQNVDLYLDDFYMIPLESEVATTGLDEVPTVSGNNAPTVSGNAI